MSTIGKYEVYIVVYRGEPVDFQQYRHTGLWFLPLDGGAMYYFDVRGSTGAFEFQVNKNLDPTETKSFAKKIKLGTTRAMSSSDLNRLMRAVPVKNEDVEFNCQGWVDLAMKDMVAAHHLTDAEYDAGLEAMVDATLEAVDESIA